MLQSLSKMSLKQMTIILLCDKRVLVNQCHSNTYRSHCVYRSVGRKQDFANHWVEFNNILHEASIPRGDMHTLKGLQLHDILQSYDPFTN